MISSKKGATGLIQVQLPSHKVLIKQINAFINKNARKCGQNTFLTDKKAPDR